MSAKTSIFGCLELPTPLSSAAPLPHCLFSWCPSNSVKQFTIPNCHLRVPETFPSLTRATNPETRNHSGSIVH
ncbi:hypothetical protein L596_022760 [Steinernema carpocapsae]|uniref:Uncharacterized protein n=1 Tax=Steinernema carpocapsae TaxID=34508 RepID=A0A4U5MN63_STECR|nr:hypothetical protein L596_022760 [Steinernema carpocapsae]